MNSSIEYTREFMLTAGQVVRNTPTQPTREELQLRLSLELEELYEKAQAFGMERTFVEMLYSKADLYDGVDTNIFDLPAVLDACADQRVVADGTILACGLADVFPSAMTDVHASNMSKFPKTMNEAGETSVNYKNQGIETSWGAYGGFWPVKRASDGKVLKSIYYRPANMQQVLDAYYTQNPGD